MNESFSARVDERILDRLVDGELSPAEYQRVLLSLEEDPGGWRRCALAFLEAQSFRRDLPARSGEPPKIELNAAVQPKPVSAAGSRSKFGLLLAVVASFLLTFVSTAAFRTAWFHRSGAESAPGLADVADSGPRPESAAPREGLPAAAPGPDVARRNEQGEESLGSVSLVVDGGAGHRSQEFDVPVIRGKKIPVGSLLSDESNLPPEFIESLRRMGHRVHRHSQLVPVELQDGSRLVVPLDEYQIVPVGSFQ